ncbi:MAG: RHS repeat-associated core domain-containing protein [Bacteroidota bacterium]
MFVDENEDGWVDPDPVNGEVLQETHFYPFGLTMADASSTAAPAVPNNYLFTGKETQDELGIGWIDFGVRMYDASVGRWNGVDKLSDDQNQIHLTPYNYSWNSPSNLTDPDGNCPSCIGALVGAALDYGTQVTVNVIEGKDWGDALTEVDMTSIAVSAAAGAVGVGLAKGVAGLVRAGSKLTPMAKTAIKVGSEVVGDASVSVASQAITEDEVKLDNVVTDVLSGQAGRQTIGRYMKKTSGNTKTGKKLQENVNKHINASKKGSKTQGLGKKQGKAGLPKAQKELDNYKAGRAAIGSGAAAGPVRKSYRAYQKLKNEDDENRK